MATARRFVKEGAHVFITERRQAELDKAVSLIGKNVTAVQGDVTNLDDLDRVAAAVRATAGLTSCYDRSPILEGMLNACCAWAEARLFDHALASKA